MAKGRPLEVEVDRNRSTQSQARRALRQSTDDLARLFETALAERRAVNMLVYLMQHDAHHRGQIGVLAREPGHQLATEDTMRIWGWKALPPRS